MVLQERVIPFVCSSRDAGNLLSSTSQPVIVSTWRPEDHMKMKGIRCSLVLFYWMPVTGLLLLNTPNSSPGNTFPLDAVP